MKLNRGSKLWVTLIVCCMTSSAGGAGADSSSNGIVAKQVTIESIAANPKLSEHGTMLAPLQNGEATISVVVSLRHTPEAKALSTRSLELKGIEANNAGAGLANVVGPYYDLSNASIKSDLASTVKNELDSFLAQIEGFNRANVTADIAGISAPITITNKFTYSFGFAANVTLSGLNYLLEDDKVVLIEENLILTAQVTQGIGLMNGTSTRSTYKGAGVAVAVADTGIDDSHPDLSGGKVLGGFDFGDNDTSYQPPAGGSNHGTSVAGIVAGDVATVGDYIGGVASDAKLYALKISPGGSGSASSADMIDAWEWAVTHQNDDPNNPILIVNTSFGGIKSDGTGYSSPCDAVDSAMTQAALNGVNAGITHFVSSGNDGLCDGMGWPACISHVNSVGAVYDANIDRKGWCVSTASCLASSPNAGCSSGNEAFFEFTAADKVTAYSNTHTNLTIFAPSNDASTTDIAGPGGASSGNYTTNFGGTSAAAPYSAGAAAVLQSAAMAKMGRFLTPAEVRSFLVNTGTPVTDSKIAITKPRVNLGAAVAALPTAPPPPPPDEGDVLEFLPAIIGGATQAKKPAK